MPTTIPRQSVAIARSRMAVMTTNLATLCAMLVAVLAGTALIKFTPNAPVTWINDVAAP